MACNLWGETVVTNFVPVFGSFGIDLHSHKHTTIAASTETEHHVCYGSFRLAKWLQNGLTFVN